MRSPTDSPLAGPTPLPPGQNDYGPLAYLVWTAGAVLILTGLYFLVRFVLRLAGRRWGGSHEGGNA